MSATKLDLTKRGGSNLLAVDWVVWSVVVYIVVFVGSVAVGSGIQTQRTGSSGAAIST